MARPLHSHAFHKDEVPLDQLAGGTATAGYAPISNGDGTATWGPAGASGGPTLLGPFQIEHDGTTFYDWDIDLPAGTVILQAFAVVTTNPDSLTSGDKLSIHLRQGGSDGTALVYYDLFEDFASTATEANYEAIGWYGSSTSVDGRAMIRAVLKAECDIRVYVTTDSDDGEWDVYLLVVQP